MGRITYTFCALLLLLFNYSHGYNLLNENLLPPPVNDDCSGATTLTVNPTEICAAGSTATFTEATVSTQGTTCTALNSADVWYQFTATSTAHTIALSNFSGSPQPMVIVVYEGDCTALSQLYCSQNNVVNASGLTIGSVYKVRIYFNTVTASTINTLFVCVTTPPPPSNNNQTECLITTNNYDFELPDLVWSNFPTFVNHNVVQGWRTTASDEMIEFWQQPNYENVPAYSGTQFIELNANVVSGVYQDYQTPQTTVFNYGFAHRGRQGTDTCQLLAGPPGGPYVNVGPPVSTGNTAWSYNTGTYTVPVGQTVTRFILQSVSSVGGASVGNFLDAISFTADNGIITSNPYYMGCGDIIADLEAAGVGTWSAHADNPSTVTISDPSANNVQISGFGPSGSYFFDWTTQYCTSTIEISFTGPYPQDPAITDITYCQNQTAVPIDIPVDQPGYTMIYYLNSNQLPDAPTPDTSVIGSTTYYVLQESDQGCQSPAYPLVVTINPAVSPVTDFTLPAAVCTSDISASPTPETGFTTGGVYTAPAGVIIDPDTGVIDLLNSTPGTYDITYTVAEDFENCLIEGSSTTPITINAAPLLMPATPLELCDDASNDGIAEFDLAPAIAEMENGQPNLTATVHLSLTDAQNNINPQSQPLFTNTIPNTQTIYVRFVEDGTTTDCYTIGEIQLTVNSSPTISSPVTDYVLCDQTDYMTPDQTEEFDLTVKDLEVTGGNPDYAVSYYETPGDADQGTNPIVNLTAYANQSNPQTIYVRLENTVTTCYDVFDFDLVVTPLPVYDSAQTDFHECEEVPGQADFDLHSHDTDLASGVSTVNVSYYNSQIEAETGDPATQLPDVYVAPDMAQIWARLQSSVTGCWTAVQITLHVDPAPIAPALTALEECAFDNDPFENFDVQSVIDYIESQLTDVTVTAHETMDDAEFGTNAINPVDYTNIVANTQTLYIRVSSAFTVCYDIEELQLIVHQAPIATDPEDYALCDNGLDDTDGVGIFVLPSRESEILGGLDPSLYTVGYYPSYGDAELEQNPIPNPGSYSATTNSAVYVRVTDNATGCYDIVTLTLIVHPLPVATQPAPYTLCDVNTIGGQPDEVEEFDLTTRIPEIIGLQTGINVTFHHSLSDADANINAIQTPEAYTNQSNAEAIYVRVTFEATGCYRIVLLDIRVEPLPVVVPPSQEALTVCDPDSDGQAQFDLDALVADMINNGENLSVTFHETAIDAELGINAIPNTDNYTNTNAYNQTIYVRVENTVTGCYTATAYALNLIVVDTPQIDADLADITLCDTDNNDQDGVMAVDLTVQDAYILEHLGNADPSDYIIHYFNDPVDAQTGAPRITNPGAYAAQDGEVIYVRIEDVATGCYSIESFTVYVNIPLALTRPPVLSVCNEALPNDMTAEFDLTVMENTILGPFGVGLGYTVNYYEPGVTTPIADPTHYVNTSNPMTLTVEVITLAGCKSTTTMTIKVLPLPTPNTAPDALVLCDDNNAGDGQEEFDLTQAAGDIMDNEPNLILSYHLTYEDADQDVNAIADPAHFVSGTATIYVRVEANTGNPNDAVCYQIVELELIVNPLPALGENGTIPAYAICEQNTDGFATFILSSHIPEILGEDADPNDYLVRFYFDQAALDAGTALPNQYNNISTPQDILVWVQHIESGCTITAPMQLLVEEAAVANAPADPVLSTCDDDGDNDGMHVFDLSVFDAEILGTQDPADYSVAYYETLEDAEDATNPIADPAVYVNTTADVMTIYARVTNTSTISGCHDITEITLIVERLPEPVITSVDGSDTICVDYTTNDVLRTVTLDSGIPSDMGYSFVWYLDGVELTDYDPASPTYEASAEGNYTVEVTGPAPLNCISDISAAFQVHQSGPASPVGPGYEVTNYFSDNQVITVFVEGYGEYEYKLDEDGMWQSSNVFTDVPAGTHTVYVRDVSTEFACDEIAIEGVSLVDYPHYFTPNGDGYHDTWNIIGLNQPDAKVYIFDRYGKLIKQISATEESEGWDGTYNGTPLPATDYWFTVTYRETVNGQPVVKEFKAHFSLKR